MYRSYRFRKRFKICLAAIAGVLVLTGTMLIISVLTQGPQPPGTTEPPPVPDLFGSGSPPASQAAAGPMRVLQGRELVNGVRLGYPHTAQGAISAADEFARDIGSALDPDTAAAILRLTADPSYSQGPQRYAQGVVTTREVLGLPASGPVPDGASAVLQPVEYQLKNPAADGAVPDRPRRDPAGPGHPGQGQPFPAADALGRRGLEDPPAPACR